jgi:DNA helicase II / ATP-dependent DNA helicase PcrA
MSGLKFTPTAEQAAIAFALRRSSDNVMVEAGAGCAKTSTLKLAAPGLKVPALALAFNRRIADDLQKALPGHFTVRTFNGLGHQVWARTLGTTLRVDDRKGGRILRDLVRRQRLDLQDEQWQGLQDLCRQAMANGLPAEGDWEGLADGSDLNQEDFRELLPLAQAWLKEDVEEAKRGVVSFDDQVYCPVVLGGRWPQFPALVVDEDQDLSPLNIRAMRLAGASGGCRVIAVGDRRQAIYAWRGASGTAAEDIRAAFGGQWTDLPLLTTFRCPRAVVERQQGHVPGYRAWDGASEGVVTRWRESWAWGHIADALPDPRASIAVVCRNNAPLLRFGMKLIRQGIGVKMLGRDIGRGLAAIVKGMEKKAGRRLSLVDMLAALADWETRELVLAEGREAKKESVYDRADCIRAASGDARDSGDVLAAIERIFSDDGGRELVTLSSIHRVKGLEFDFVLHLDPWRVPQKWAKEGVEMGQEMNARYVAETRTRHTLAMGSLDHFAVGEENA